MIATLRQRISVPPISKDLGFWVTLILTVFFGFTSIAHQNVAVVLQSYVLGDVAIASGTILFFVMGGYLLAGLYLFLKRNTYDSHASKVVAFVKAELILLAISAFSAFVVFYFANYFPEYGEMGIYAFYAYMNALVGFEDLLLLTLIGVTLPRVGDAGTTFQTLSAIGGMAAGLILGRLLVPAFGITLTPVLLGYIDGIGVLLVLIVFRTELRLGRFVTGISVWAVIMAGIVFATINQQQFDLMVKRPFYEGHIVFSEPDLYGDMVFTCTRRNSEICQFFMDGHIQWGTHPGDEELYHDLITHVPLSVVLDRNACRVSGCVRPLDILILGGGDGMATRELVKYPDSLVAKIDLVDLNVHLTQELARQEPMALFNGNSFSDRRVRIFNQDAFEFVQENGNKYDLILVDLVDPRTDAVAKLYSLEFYHLAKRHLNVGGVFITQASSPQSSGRAFWRINYTLDQTFRSTVPYHANIASFGDWGFVMASEQEIDPSSIHLRDGYPSYITDDTFRSTLGFLPSMLRVESNKLFPEDTKEAVYASGESSTLSKPLIREDYTHHNRWELWED